MRIKGYGIALTRLTSDEIELVREHRNSETIKQFMEYREEISAEQQKLWFESINNLNNNYLIIHADGKKIGLIYGSNIDWDKKETGNGGIFIWDTAYWNTPASIAASFLLTDTSVLFGLERTYIKVLKTNKPAIAFNTSLGYRLLPGQENQENQQYVLHTQDYIRCRNVLRSKIFKPADYAELIFEVNPDDPTDRFYLERIEQLPETERAGFKVVLAAS
ncbi:MAG: GNAT family N-acetyltransferase [Flavobacteriales bacterium]|nr:GNAT family N-acetyltransferase [Flavobacteriales bacterium]